LSQTATTSQPAGGKSESRRSLLLFIAAILLVSAGTQWWGWRHEQQIGREIASLARDGDIEMLATDCDYCEQARSYLKSFAIRYTECPIDKDSACAARHAALKKKGMPVVLVRGEAYEGFMPAKVLERLRKG
jgi:glutaredoxin